MGDAGRGGGFRLEAGNQKFGHPNPSPSGSRGFPRLHHRSRTQVAPCDSTLLAA